MWVMVLIILSNMSSTDMTHIDDINASISQRFDSEEACHNELYRQLDIVPKNAKASITKNEGDYLTLTWRSVNTLVFTCINTIKITP